MSKKDIKKQQKTLYKKVICDITNTEEKEKKMSYIINGACKSVIGKVRKNNEDNYYFNFKTLKEENEGNSKTLTMQFENIDNIICAVFDGMGGEVRGERASYLATSTLKEYIQKNVNREFRWREYIEEANRKICEEMSGNARMGTTIAATQFLKDKISICNIGDSRIYGLKGKTLEQISEDHTEAKMQERLQINTGHKARLTQHLGIRKDEMILKPYINKIEYDEYEKILICSDGLTDMLEDKEIEAILSQKREVKEIVEELIRIALERGGTDNITVIVLEIQKNKGKNYKKIIPIIVVLIVAIIIFAMMMKGNEFKIIKDEYPGSVIVGQSYEFEYEGKAEIEINNDNIEYNDGKITAKKEGTSTITIKDKDGQILYNKTIKVFPK